MTFSTILLLAAAAAPAPGRPGAPATAHPRSIALPHSVAEVNDPRSHGQVGDNLLSLNEAIQLYNRTLPVAALSPAEQAQLNGAGADIALARINGLVVPNITVERDLDVLQNWPHGLIIDGYNGRPQIDFSGANVNHGFRSVSDFCSWSNLELLGGPYAIDLVQTDASFGGTVIQNVQFFNQTRFAVAVRTAAAPGLGRVLFQRCVFFSLPLGISFDETAAGRTTLFGVFDTRFLGTATAIDCALGDGGQAQYLFDAVSVQNATTGIHVRRPAGANRPVTMQATHVRVAASDCFRYEGRAGVVSDLRLRVLHLTAGAGGSALHLGPLGGDIGGELHECTATGDVTVETGGGSDIAIANARVGAGNVTLGTTSATPLQVVESRFDGSTIATTGQQQVEFTRCCFVGGALQGTASAPIEVGDSFVSATLGAQVTQFGGVPAPQLGSMSVAPALPALGGTVTLTPDLPAGLIGIFVVGAAAPVSEPLPGVRAYFDVPGMASVGLTQQQQPVVLAVPVNLALLGTAWVAQIAVVPSSGVQAPAVQTPPGVRFAF